MLNLRKFIYWFLAAALLVCSSYFLTGCLELLPRETTGGHLLLGNPSLASSDPSNSKNYLIKIPQYALSYNAEQGTANWVSWQLNKSWLGKVDRQDNFRPDDSLPDRWHKVSPKDYTNSGYDRGHLIPSADRTKTIEDNSATFLMTNIIPQTPDNNRGSWAELEKYSRQLVDEGRELYIIAGGMGKKKAIAKGKVIPPSQVWKIIVALDRPGTGIQGINLQTRVIAVSIPNDKGIKAKSWESYRVSVDSLEQATGYDFLRAVDTKIQEVLEAKVDQL